MSWLEDIGTYLQSNGVGTVGSDIFYSVFDSTSKNCILLIKQTGQSTKTTLRKDSILKRPELGVRVKNEDDVTADELAESIENLLDITYNKVIGSTRFKSIRAIAPHFFVSQDDNENFIYSINFALEIG